MNFTITRSLEENRFFSKENFKKFNIFNLGFTLLVIVWGAYVRASGSGAGCGAHWPLCNGEVLPPTQSIKTLVEFIHRITSGLSLALVGIGFFWSRKITHSISILGKKIRKCALFSVVAILMEALLGAGLVLLKLVEFDQSALRAISISLHLVNTLFLLSTLTSLTWFSFQREETEKQIHIIPRNSIFQITLSVFVFLGVAGAITALGDTLFPSVSLSEGMKQDLSLGAHFLLKLRVIHPLLAVAWVMLAFVWSKKLEHFELMSVRAYFLLAVCLQFLLGFVNWILMAPTFMQLVHLFVADLVFIIFLLTGLKHEARESRLQA